MRLQSGRTSALRMVNSGAFTSLLYLQLQYRTLKFFHTLYYIIRIICFLCLFRMSFSDFLSHYSRIEICTLTPDAITSDSVKHWAVTNHDGTWRKGSTAGGCRNNPCKPQKNRKHTIKHRESDSDFITKNDSHGQSLVVVFFFFYNIARRCFHSLSFFCCASWNLFSKCVSIAVLCACFLSG